MSTFKNCDNCKWNYCRPEDPYRNPCLICNDYDYINFEPYYPDKEEKEMTKPDELTVDVMVNNVPENKRHEILRLAEECVNGEREQDYGTPEDNFSVIADLWSIYKNHPYTAEDVAMMMILLKIARIKSGNGSLDSFIDLAGYAACAGEIWDKYGKGKKNE